MQDLVDPTIPLGKIKEIIQNIHRKSVGAAANQDKGAIAGFKTKDLLVIAGLKHSRGKIVFRFIYKFETVASDVEMDNLLGTLTYLLEVEPSLAVEARDSHNCTVMFLAKHLKRVALVDAVCSKIPSAALHDFLNTWNKTPDGKEMLVSFEWPENRFIQAGYRLDSCTAVEDRIKFWLSKASPPPHPISSSSSSSSSSAGASYYSSSSNTVVAAPSLSSPTVYVIGDGNEDRPPAKRQRSPTPALSDGADGGSASCSSGTSVTVNTPTTTFLELVGLSKFEKALVNDQQCYAAVGSIAAMERPDDATRKDCWENLGFKPGERFQLVSKIQECGFLLNSK